MMHAMIPEVAQLNQASSLVRIPPAEGVPISPRVRRIIDSPPMRRLASISQLGMVALVYPGATHSRFEHSLGVYLNSLRLLARFTGDASLNPPLDARSADAFVLAALLHDVGHWPFCHPIEDMKLAGFREHESRVSEWIQQSELRQCIQQDWSCEIQDVVDLLEPAKKSAESPTSHIPLDFLRSCLSGPIDIDKLDYLQRDSLHSGVPYGRNFDVGRLIESMCVHPTKGILAIGEKGRTAAEMMVFARYVMFSEVYWHHTVRAATAMLQRAVFLMKDNIELESTFKLNDAQWIARLVETSNSIRDASLGNTHQLVDGLFGAQRRLYKRVAEFSAIDAVEGQPVEVHRQIARRPYWWLVAASEKLAARVSSVSGEQVVAEDILIDAPPVKLEVDINVDVILRDGSFDRAASDVDVSGGADSPDKVTHSRLPIGVTLANVSPVARALARQQFDDQVKRVRVFVNPEKRDLMTHAVRAHGDWSTLLIDVVQSVDNEIV
ncbi:HD domain-containing protein [Novipirellula sp.]|uniref:HD domain-containing protein n=1 Tax=Novipirellula sp. TaxID=2795430 RepID=UPI00356528FF